MRMRWALEEDSSAARYALQLLEALGVEAQRPVAAVPEHPAAGWARSGLMALTGAADGAPQMCPVPLTACADGALAALASLAPENALGDLRGSQLLTERAAIAGYSRRGAISPGGSCRLLEAADGWLALNLARDEDWALLPAWLEGASIGVGDWDSVARALRERAPRALVERGRELGLALAEGSPSPLAPPPRGGRGNSKSGLACSPSPPCDRRESRCRGTGEGFGRGGSRKALAARPPRVLDMSSLWAGPLCGHLLQLCGAEVIKLESLARPDGVRRGPAQFFDLLNAGKRSVALDFGSAPGREQLRRLILKADIVIEGSRPRALRQLGIHAEAMLEQNPALTWVSISGHGRGERQENWVAYGDDAAVDAGLSQLMLEATGQHLICGDAIADPLTGLHAALAAWAGYQAGGGGLISLALSGVVSDCIHFDLPPSPAALRERQGQWLDHLRATGIAAVCPRARTAGAAARALGADTDAVLAD